MFEDSTTITLSFTLFISIILGVIGLIAFLWGLRSGQFDDSEKFTSMALFDGEDELNDAKAQEEKLKKKKQTDDTV